MYNSAFPKIEYYLYNYREISDRINKLNTQNANIDYDHFNYGLWIRTKLNRGNSLENQVLNKINNECIIKKLNLWKNLIQEVLKEYKETDILKYKFICLKYIKKLSDTEIEEILKIDKYKQKDIRANILHYIFLLCLKKNILREVK